MLATVFATGILGFFSAPIPYRYIIQTCLRSSNTTGQLQRVKIVFNGGNDAVTRNCCHTALYISLNSMFIAKKRKGMCHAIDSFSKEFFSRRARTRPPRSAEVGWYVLCLNIFGVLDGE